MATSIQNVLYTSLTSLDVTQQQINILSNNIANANTPGYVQQSLQTAEQISNGVGVGVQAESIQRMTNAAAAATANQANGTQAYSQEMVNVLTNYTNVLGQASDSGSLPSMLSALGSQLTTLSATPGDTTAQEQVVSAAQGVVNTFHGLDSAIDSAREQADQGIASGVASVNTTLNQLAQNQTAMQTAQASGGSIASYQDTQDQLVASLAKQLPVKVFQGGTTGLVVTTDQGTTLFDGQVHALSFSATPNITSATGSLSAVTVDNQPIQMSQSGSIAADLQLRDVTLPGFANQLDSLAGNLITSFQAADPTASSSNQPGLFTDAGAMPPSSGSTTDLAGSIALNAAVDPAKTGNNPARIQSGMYVSPTSSTASDNTTILNLINALQQPSSTSGSGQPSTSILDDASQMAGSQQAQLSNWTSVNTGNTAQAQTATTALSNATGVNIDDQLQQLMTLEHTYSASAQVMQAASSMLNQLIQAV
ncbi:flagellar hook-associated protein FlgK [Rhodopila globiformis]|uniref:Flagellar hook-associated protein 1 n=1 Tax=Rhodopila globiformis TaxID=1071 RepID=A0A2S6MZ24_RHOGL|nr:flagellar hook-associated protein FlgK [Rhodopila globiformis]PPQ27617.1 flagellar hook-associated protein FlgK [Rhodopila globiformis]